MDDIYLTSIKKKAKKYEIIIRDNSDSYQFKISEDLLIDSSFFSYRSLSKEEYKAFLNKLPLDSLVFEGEKYLDRKDRSEREVKDHLMSFSSDSLLLNEAIEILKRKGLINDSVFLERYVNYAITIKKDGRLKIENQLTLYGLKDSFYYPEDLLKSNIKDLSLQYNESLKGVPYRAKIDKTKRYLLSKGYTERDIDKHFFISFIEKEDEGQSFKKELDKLKRKTDDIHKIKDALRKKGYSRELIDSV